MRVLHVAEAFGGGVFEVVRLLTERSVGRGHEMAIAYGFRPETPEDVRERIDPSVELFPLEPWASRSPQAQLRARRELRRLISQWKPEILHLHSSFAGIVGIGAGPWWLPTVYTPHAYAFSMKDQSRRRRIGYLLLERRVARRATLVAGVSRSEARLARAAVDAPRVEAVANGIPELDPGQLPPVANRPSPIVLAMGRIGPQRQADACARILGQVADVAEVAWVGGAAPGKPGLVELEAAGVPVTGWVDRAIALERLGAATAYLHWTAWDGQPLSVLEAMARDVVVVASDIEPNFELLGPEQVCRDEQEAAELLRRVVLDPSFRERLLESQRARRAYYGTERMVDEWLALYERVPREP